MTANSIALSSQQVSQPLAEAIRDAAKGAHPDAGLNPLAAWLRPEAEKAKQRLDAALAPSDPATIVRWIAPLAALVGSQPSTPKGDDLRAAVQAMAYVLADLPACCWTHENQKAAGRAFKYWPSPKEITDLVMLTARPLQEERLALMRLLRLEAKRGSPAERAETMEEREANAATNRATLEAMRTQMEERERAARPSGATKANHISPAHRIAFHRGKGQHAVADAIAKANGIDERDEIEEERA